MQLDASLLAGSKGDRVTPVIKKGKAEKPRAAKKVIKKGKDKKTRAAKKKD